MLEEADDGVIVMLDLATHDDEEVLVMVATCATEHSLICKSGLHNPELDHVYERF